MSESEEYEILTVVPAPPGWRAVIEYRNPDGSYFQLVGQVAAWCTYRWRVEHRAWRGTGAGGLIGGDGGLELVERIMNEPHCVNAGYCSPGMSLQDYWESRGGAIQ